MTGRTSSTSISTNSRQRPNSPLTNQKQTRKRTNSSNTLASTAKEDPSSTTTTKFKASGQSNFDLRDALDSARRSFEKGMRCNISNRKRPLSGLNNPTSLSPGVSTRSSSSNLNSTSPNLCVSSNFTPDKKSPKKSSSAPASPVKACGNVTDNAQTKSPSSKRTKVLELNNSINKKLILRSDLLLIKAEDVNTKDSMAPLDAEVTSMPIDSSDMIINLPSPPIHTVKKYSPKDSDSSNSSVTSVTRSVMRKEPFLPLTGQSKLSLYSSIDSTLDTSFASNKISINTSPTLSTPTKSPTGKSQVPKSPTRMLLSDSKRTSSSNLNKNKPVSMNEVIKLHQDEGVMHLLHGLPSSRRARQPAGAVSATIVRRRASNEFTQAAILQQAQAQAAQGRHSDAEARENKATSTHGSIPGLVRKSIAAGYGPIQHRPRPRQHSQGANSLYCPLSHIKPCKLDELMTSENLEILKHLPTQNYVRLWSSPSRYVLRDQQQHLIEKTSASNNLPNNLNHVSNPSISSHVSNTSAISHISGKLPP